MEKIRAATLKTRSGEETSSVNIITSTLANCFYYISGVFYGLFKSKSKQRFIALTQPSVTAVHQAQDGWQKKKIALPGSFVGISPRHVETCSFKDIA